MVSRELVSEMLAKYDVQKEKIAEKYKQDKRGALIMTLIGIVLIVIGIFFLEFIWIFLIIAAILFYKARSNASLAKFNYKYSLGQVWNEFSNNDFVELIVRSLENGESSTCLKDPTFKNLNMGSLSTIAGDTISCDYNNERFTVANFHAYYVEEDIDTGKTHDFTMFDGLTVIKPIKKKVSSEVVVAPYRFDALANYNKVSMDNSKFNKTFEVYARENKDAFISLTPEVIECLLDLSNRFIIGAIVVKNNNLYVFLNYRKITFDIQDAKIQKMKPYKKALKFMTVDFTIQNVAKFNENYFRIVDEIKKINI